MSGPRVAVVGSSNTDMVIRAERIPVPGETVLGGSFVLAAGGKGANQAVAAARLGAQVTLVARVGTDMFGEQSLRNFQEEGIRTDRIVKDPSSPSGVALIMVDRHGENIIAVASGANGLLSASDVEAARAEIGAADVLLLQLEIPLEAVRHAARLASEAGVLVILNPAPARKLDPALLRHVTVLTPNETETELLTGVRITDEDAAGQAAGILREQGVDTVVITRGAAGSFLVGAGGTHRIPARAVRAVDTTAAGDAFNGALAVALGGRRPIEEAVRFANLAGAFAATRLGAQPSLPTAEALEAFTVQRDQ